MRQTGRVLLAILIASFSLIAQEHAQQEPAQAPSGRVAALAASKDSLHELSDSIEALSHSVSLAVVQVFATGYALAEEESGGDATTTGLVTKQRSSGSGVVLSADGYIVTNNHVVRNARRIRVQLVSLPDSSWQSDTSSRPGLHAHGKLMEAKVVGVDREADLAVIKVDTDMELPVLKLADSDNLRQGQVVMAFGNPLGLENSVSLGIVSSAGRQIKPDDPMVYIQTDASINPGNSGGPLMDVNGDVVGINTFILSQSGGSEGIGFAIPSNVVKNVYEQIRKDGHVHRGEIGVTAQSITPELAAGLDLKQDTGVILGDVAPDGPADKAGLKAGDVVISLNGKPMRNAREFETALYRIRLNQTVEVEAVRGTEKVSAKVMVSERDDDPFRYLDLVKPEENRIPKLGIVGVPITPEIARVLPDTRKPYGVIVAARTGDAEYSGQGGLKLGDVIYSVNNAPVSTLQALRTAVDNLKITDPLVLQIEREGSLLYLTLSEE
ncbi:MAG TPA: trypsin-like peptidase domain-containing protein [Bryobacteraceae bacterium]|nr:trypsin-like peptidase domain-containing protein [Bryobacteraceae bacterium]